MGHAWLDSLSEDWVSQPGSDAPIAPLNDATNTKPTQNSPTPSRIPRLNKTPKKSHTANNENSSGILSERSVNEIFGSAARRSPPKSPSKLSQEIKAPERGRLVSRSFSESTAGSVVHNTVQQKSLSASPAKRRGETPEWKRRLVYGDLSYGEQPDLFTSAATGLENMFKPPPPAPEPPRREHYEDDRHAQHEITLPSSPPVYGRDPSTVDIHVDESVQELPEPPRQRAPTSMQYRRTDESFDPSVDSEPSIAPDSSQAVSNTDETAFSPQQSDRMTSESRKTSGRSDVRNEDFSPILIERRQASDGKETFGPADLPPDELRKRLEKLRRNQMLIGGEYEPSDNQGNMETEDYERLGGFVNFRRGGRSADGSFRNHGLSATMNDTSELCPEESLQASTPKQFPTFRMETWEEANPFAMQSPNVPRPPNPSPQKRAAQAQESSASPLKLFQSYDTFTSQTLLRRLSQFQSAPAENESGEQRDYAHDESEASVWRPANQDWERSIDADQSCASVNQFGTGHFDGYVFNEEFSYQSNDVSGFDTERENHYPEGQPQAPIFDLSHDSSPAEDEQVLQVQRKRQKSNASGSSRRSSGAEPADKRRELQAPFPNLENVTSTPKRKDRASEIKRPRTSPSKDPTPKRRRTLHKSDVAYGTEDHGGQALGPVQLSHRQMQSIMTRKRKDARQGDHTEQAKADVLADRQMLRPRTPTPTQRSSLQRDHAPLPEAERSPARSARRPLPPTPGQYGTSLDTDRKPSINTEDFLSEANKIMAIIRNKAGLASGLASLEESDTENLQNQTEGADTSYESTQEPFDRPPSREGRRPITRISNRQEDPEVVERLKKYEEPSELGDIIGSSVRSMPMAQEAIRAAKGESQGTVGTTSSRGSRPSILDAEEVCDPPNIRISHSPDWQPTETLTSGVRSQASSGSHSTTRSIPTGSSRGSETKKVIAPESVSHLIPEQVGNMVLDKQRNIWIKRKADPARRKPRSNYLSSEASEDDPFADIPDLTVDMTLEMQNLRLTSPQKPRVTPDGQMNGSTANSPTKPSNTGSLQPKCSDVPSSLSTGQDTRAVGRAGTESAATMTDGNEQVEHEISINEDRIDTRKRRNLTISFSSPIASIIQDRSEGPASPTAENEAWGHPPEDAAQDSMRRGRDPSLLPSRNQNSTSRSRSRSQGPARHLSVRGQTFYARPVSRIDEGEEESVFDRFKNRQHVTSMELSILPENSIVAHDGDEGHETSMSVVVATPARPQDCPAAGADAAPVISQYVGTLSLSPLSEFTIHHSSDESSLPLEASYVVGDHHLVTGKRSKRVLSMNTRALVAKIAEVEPFEPYWEHMKELELRNKRLESIHALGEFCTGLEKLDISDNEIRNLNGIPVSVRQLKITNNQLSSLTAWGHLMNLQYVDVSNNGITSLAGFKNLVHLRTLRADNNELTSLDGIKFHDGLQVLRARGNPIEELDFDGNQLESLTDLDLRDNQIRHVANLEQLPVLESINLEGNQLESFSVSSEKPLLSLRHLRLDNNKLKTLDLHYMPHLRLLNADRNQLVQIKGFSRARRIDSLSLREQRGETPLDVPNLLSRAYEVRKLFLSGNFIGEFKPTVDLLNLQLLELANCGLQSLPENLGFMLPNLRAINLNMNALSDLSSLRCIPRLKRILVSGNRIADSAALVKALSEFEHLREVDVRDNPITQGFYAPVQVMVRSAATDGEESKGPDPFVLPDQDKDRDVAYCSRLDMETRLRRRLYEQMIARACKRVRKLDGLDLVLGREGVDRRDVVWRILKERGFVSGEDDEMDKSRWPAEDSFA
ncbi:hypothetical protein QBC47DRAFT_369523 [Echria macrotheca]|uniref:Septation initiation network scaffold protein cdc11 n=1 Tax=Echria macrotheca TaxID=438768 RepID=A0AAJ0BPZ4_9PEZI|nr:hypothetical protein QBC47DRAFT_369523 [Echria macrotheca]